MDAIREDRLRQLEENLHSCRTAVLRDVPGAVGDFTLQKVVRSTIMLCSRLRGLCTRLARYCRVRQLWADDESRDIRLEKLGKALLEVFNLSGGAAKLEEAIAAYEEALQLRPLGHDRRAAALNNLGEALRRSCQLVNIDTTRLDRSILLHHEALQLCPPGHPTRDASLYNLPHRSTSVSSNREGWRRWKRRLNCIARHCSCAHLAIPFAVYH
jgi:tetratricopeptide (TPR) repeat protein